MNKQTIREIVIVEGKSDTNKLKKLFNLRTYETNGLDLNDSKLNLIKKLNDSFGVILFLDPDGPGEKIRKQIINYLKCDVKNCFIKKEDIKYGSKKIGIAEANDSAIISALNNVAIFKSNNNSLTLLEWNELCIDNKYKRQIICDALNISMCNNKQLFKRLNMLNLTKLDIENILKSNLIYK